MSGEGIEMESSLRRELERVRIKTINNNVCVVAILIGRVRQTVRTVWADGPLPRLSHPILIL